MKLKELMKSDEPENEETQNETPNEAPKMSDVPKIPDKMIDEMSTEDIDKKQKIIFKIQKYQDSSRFGDIVRHELKFNQKYDELSDMTMNELENMLSRIRIHLDNKNLDKFYDSIVTSGAVMYEQSVSMFYDIEGFSDILLDNDEFWNCVERFKCETELPSVNPTTQVLYMIAQATIMAHHLPKEESDRMESPPPFEQVLETIEEEPSTESTPKSDIKPSTNENESTPKLPSTEPLKMGQIL